MTMGRSGVKAFLIVVLLLLLIVFSVISLVNSRGYEQITPDNNDVGGLSGNLDGLSQKLKDTSTTEGSYLQDKTIIKKGSRDSELPKEILISSRNFLKSFAQEEDLKDSLHLKEWVLLKDASSTYESYLLTYSLKIESYRQNGKKTISEYSLRVNMDEGGNIIDAITPKEKYDTIKKRGI